MEENMEIAVLFTLFDFCGELRRKHPQKEIFFCFVFSEI